jgi:hypothetical protein
MAVDWNRFLALSPEDSPNGTPVTPATRNGNVVMGQDAIQKMIATNAPKWTELTITSDTLRVVGKTAWDVGTSRTRGSEGGEQVYHYLSVLRCGPSSWRIERLAVVPESHEASGADSSKTR